MNNCCTLRVFVRFLREGGARPGELFTCDKCGRAYRKLLWNWEEVSVVDEIKDMNAHKEEIIRGNE